MSADFDGLARAYRYLEGVAFGRALWRRRVAYLGRMSGARRVLLAGEGDGRFLAAFLRAYPEAEADYVDGSERMLATARARCGERARYFRVDLLADPAPEGPYDLLVTHFFLDCFTEAELDVVVGRLALAAGAEARWVVSEFDAPGWWARWAVGALYRFFGVTTGLAARRLPGYAAALRRVGFVLEARETALAGLLVSELWVRRGDGENR
jgi:SAM-dependent methyltransferase